MKWTSTSHFKQKSLKTNEMPNCERKNYKVFRTGEGKIFLNTQKP